MKEMKNLGIVPSLSIARILRGFSAEKAVVVKQMNFVYRFLSFFGRIYLSLEDLGQVYFYLSGERCLELKKHLGNIAKNFSAWKKFYEKNRYAVTILKDMALSEMSEAANDFREAYDGFKLSAGNIIMEQKFLSIMKNKAVSFEEKFIVVKSDYQVSEDSVEELFLMIKSFFNAEQFVCIPGLSNKYKNKGQRKMLELSDNFKNLIRAHNRTKPGAPLRREIVATAKNYELLQDELIQAYYEEKTWTNLKRMLFDKIERLVLGIEDWLEVLVKYGNDRKLKNLAMNKMRQLGLGFDQLNNTLNRAKDPEIRIVILEEMFSLAFADFAKLSVICNKCFEFPHIFDRVFSSMLELARSSEDSTKVCDILIKSKSRSNTDFLLRILKIGISFENLEKLFAKSSQDGKKILILPLRLAATGNFNHLFRAFFHIETINDRNKKRYQNKCLKDMISLGEESHKIEHLLKVYRLALSVNNFIVSERVVNLIRETDHSFSSLLSIYENLEKDNIVNNDLAIFLQGEMIAKAQNNSEKALAFMKAPLQIKNIALANLLKVA